MISKTRVIPNNVCIVISTQFNLNCIFRIDLIHLQQKSLQEYVNTITCTRILNLNSVRKLHLQSCYEPDDLTSKTNKELVDLVVNNTKVIDSARNWNLLLYKEALHIKRRKCVLNNGLKASKELQLFN